MHQKFANGVPILFARFRPISAKYLLKFSAIESVLVMSLLSRLILFGNFCRREEFLSIASFITDHVIFKLFLYFIIKLEKLILFAPFLICSNKFLYFLYAFSAFLYLVFKNFSYRRCLCFDDFLIPFVIQGLCMSLVFSFIISIGKYSENTHHKET